METVRGGIPQIAKEFAMLFAAEGQTSTAEAEEWLVNSLQDFIIEHDTELLEKIMKEIRAQIQNPMNWDTESDCDRGTARNGTLEDCVEIIRSYIPTTKKS